MEIEIDSLSETKLRPSDFLETMKYKKRWLYKTRHRILLKVNVGLTLELFWKKID